MKARGGGTTSKGKEKSDVKMRKLNQIKIRARGKNEKKKKDKGDVRGEETHCLEEKIEL